MTRRAARAMGRVDTIVEPHWYSFVEERHFPARDLDRRLELPARHVTLFARPRTRPITPRLKSRHQP